MLCWNVLSDSNSLSSLCEHACVCVFVDGGLPRYFCCGDISVARVRLKRLHSFHIKAKPVNILFIFYTGRGSSVGSV